MKKLSLLEIQKELKVLDGWSYNENSISKTFVFKNFMDTFAFMSKVALISEKLGHHPDWSGKHNKIIIKLNTHEIDGITTNDIKFAKMLGDYV